MEERRSYAKDVINSIVSDIASCTNQQEQLNLASTAFGTLGEDANMQVITSLTTLGDEYNNVSGAAQKMGDETTTPMQKLQSAINEMKIALAPLGEKLAELATQILPPLANAIVSIVNGFLNLPGPVQTFLGVLAGLIALLTTLAPIITAIVTIVSTFGTAVLAPLIGIIAGVAAAITAIILVIQNWGAITEWLGNVWDAIKTKLSEVWNSIKETATNVFNSIKEFLTSSLNSIKEFFSNTWNSIKNTVSNVVNSIKTSAVNGFNNMVNGIKNTVSTVGSVIKNGFQSAINFITSLPGKALGWGRDFINGLKDGIMAGVDSIVNAVRNVANRIRSFLHFSRPDEGPLRDYETWMPDFMSGLADGIYRNIDKIEKAASDVSGTINSTITGRVADIASNTPTLGGGMIVVDGDTIVLDGKAIGKSATKYISTNQQNNLASKGVRLRYV